VCRRHRDKMLFQRFCQGRRSTSDEGRPFEIGFQEQASNHDKEGDTVDFMLSEKRDEPAARAFFEKTIGSSDLPDKVTTEWWNRTIQKNHQTNEGIQSLLFC
jgi:DDE domain